MTAGIFSDKFSGLSAQQRLNIRYVGAISGCYSLSSRMAAHAAEGSTSKGDDADSNGDKNAPLNVFACRAQSLSPQGTVVAAPVSGEIGEAVVTKFEDFNIIRGKISRYIEGGFAIDFDVNDEEADHIAAKIDWLRKRRSKTTREQRAQKRIIPPNPRSAVTMPDGTVVECLVMDVSTTGVAVSADVMPKIGTRLAVGKAVGAVVRHVEAGFAVNFDHQLELDEVDGIFAWSLNFVR